MDSNTSLMKGREAEQVVKELIERWQSDDASETDRDSWLGGLMDMALEHVERAFDKLSEEHPDERDGILEVRESVRKRYRMEALRQRRPGIDDEEFGPWCLELMELGPSYAERMFTEMMAEYPDRRDSIMSVKEDVRMSYKIQTMLAKEPATESEQESWLQELLDDDPHLVELLCEGIIEENLTEENVDVARRLERGHNDDVEEARLLEKRPADDASFEDMMSWCLELLDIVSEQVFDELFDEMINRRPGDIINFLGVRDEIKRKHKANVLFASSPGHDVSEEDFEAWLQELKDVVSEAHINRLRQQRHFKKLISKQLTKPASESWLPVVTNVDVEELAETIECLIKTVLDKSDLLDEIAELKEPFERVRLAKEWLTEPPENEALDMSFCRILEEQPELLEGVYGEMISGYPDYEDFVRENRRSIESKLERYKDLDLTTGELDSSGMLLPMEFEAGLVHDPWLTTDDSDEEDMSFLSFLLDTDNAVLDQMLEKRARACDGQTDEVLKGMKIIKMKKLLATDKTLSESLPRDSALKLQGPVLAQSDVLNRDAWEAIHGHYPTCGDVDKMFCMVRPTDELLRTYEFVKCRLELVQLLRDVQGEDSGDRRHADLLQEVGQILILIRGLRRLAKDYFVKAIKNGNEETVRRFLEAGFDADYRLGTNVHSPLILAVSVGNERITELLLQASCDVNVDDGAAMLLALSGGHNGIVAKLVEAGFVVTPDNVSDAIKFGHVDILETLLNSGVDVDCHGEDWLLVGLLTGQLDVVTLLLDLGVKCALDEDTTLGLLLAVLKDFEAKLPKLSTAITLLLHQRMLPVTWSQTHELVKHVARRGFTDLYRMLVGYCSPAYPELYELPHEAELPYSQAVDYRVHRYISERLVCDLGSVDKWFPVVTELPALPGYGNVNRLQGFQEVFNYCNPIIEELVSTSGEWLTSKVQLIRCGSSAEGTKVGLPDEFDYQVRFHVEDLIVDSQGYGYCLIQHESNDSIARLINRGSKLFHDDSTSSMYLGPIRDKKITVPTPLSKGGGTASTEWNVRYRFDEDHCLDISIDMVPVVHVDGWPTDARQDTWLMDSASLRAEGYAFVAKPPSRKSEFGKPFPHHVQQRMWRISFGHLEAKHLAHMHSRIKDVYITCKALRDPDISHMMFKDRDGKALSVSRDLITSYWLKMVFMFNVPEFLLHKRSLVEMVYIVYSQVERCISQWWLPFYWQPHINIVEGLSQDPSQCKQAANMMKRLVTGWFMRDGQRDTVEEEDRREGGVYPYLPRRNRRESRERQDDHDYRLVDAAGSLTDFEGDEYIIVIYSRTTNSIRDPGYSAYSV